MKVLCSFTLRTIGKTSFFQKSVQHYNDFELDFEDTHLPVSDIFDNIVTIITDKLAKVEDDVFYVVDDFTCNIVPNVIAWRMHNGDLNNIITWKEDGSPIRELDFYFKTSAEEEEEIEEFVEEARILENEPDEYLPENV